MWWINVKTKLLSFLVILFLLTSCFKAVHPSKKTSDESEAAQKQIVLMIDRLLKNERFTQAQHYAVRFKQRYPKSPYIDDVAFRLAYLHVIDAPNNPFFDYQKAYKAFQEFLEKFPQSRYALACNNWRKVLYLHFQLKKRLEQSERQNQALRKQLKEKANEIERLKNTLLDLEKVIKR